MLSCWAKEPEKRPPFDTLQGDLDDFEIACENKYNKKYDQYETDYKKHGGGKSKGGKGRARHDKNKKKEKKKK